MLQLRRLAQAGFVLRAEGTAILIDAFLSPRADRLVPPRLAPEALGGMDAILATHEHRDHLDLLALSALVAASAEARVVVPAPIVDRITPIVLAERIVGATVGEAIAVGAARIVPVPALHGSTMADAYSFGREPDGRARFLGYVIELGGVTVYHAGDSLVYQGQAAQLRELGVDLALLPINGRSPEREARGLVGNMDHLEAADLAATAGIRALVPMHHDTIDGNTGSVAALRVYARDRHPDLAVVELAPFTEARWPPGPVAAARS